MAIMYKSQVTIYALDYTFFGHYRMVSAMHASNPTAFLFQKCLLKSVGTLRDRLRYTHSSFHSNLLSDQRKIPSVGDTQSVRKREDTCSERMIQHSKSDVEKSISMLCTILEYLSILRKCAFVAGCVYITPKLGVLSDDFIEFERSKEFFLKRIVFLHV